MVCISCVSISFVYLWGSGCPAVPKEQQLYEVKSFDNLIDYKRETERTKAPKKVARRVSQRLPFCSGAEGGTLKTFSFHCGGEVSILHYFCLSLFLISSSCVLGEVPYFLTT